MIDSEYLPLLRFQFHTSRLLPKSHYLLLKLDYLLLLLMHHPLEGIVRNQSRVTLLLNLQLLSRTLHIGL